MEMKVIKKYNNRKMYDTTSSKYVTLNDIGNMVLNNEEVIVIDNVTKQDITSLTLATVLCDETRCNRLGVSRLKELIVQAGKE